MQTAQYENVHPVHLEWQPDGNVAIVWDDAHQSVYAPMLLREKCPCATCTGAHGPPTTLVRQSRGGLPIVSLKTPRKAMPSMTVTQVDPVGRYAMRFTWGDGHNAGIYSYRHLRAICPCAECEAERAGTTAQPV